MTDEQLRQENERLRAQVRELQARMFEPEDTIRAIREGEVDAVVVTSPEGERIYSLRSADVLYRAMVEEMKEGALVLDPNGLILYCNPQFARLVNTEREELLGSSILPLVVDASRSAFDRLRQTTSGGVHKELGLLAREGEIVPVYASVNRIHLDDSDILGMIVTDLRDQRLRQELLAQNNRKDEFLAMLAHELRNPLAPIRNALALMDTPDLPKPAFDWARQVIDRQVSQLVRLLDDLLDVQRFSHGVIDLQTKVTELGTLIESGIEALRSSATAKEQELRVERSPQPLFVMADSVRLTQVISNLLVNAVKYSPPKSHITVSWRRVGRNAQVRIADDGIGMTPELVEQVFNPFVQGDRDLSRSQGGLGLGLTLVKRLVELHGGSVKAASAGPGHGSEFTLTLPLLFDEASRPTTDERRPVRERSQPKRVLVVDDNEDSASSLCALLAHAGHRTRMALDGQEALSSIAELEPHVIILDIGLPGMDGFEVARRLREMGALKACRLVALSGYGRNEDRDRTRASGFDAHLVKPVEMDALLDVVESA